MLYAMTCESHEIRFAVRRHFSSRQFVASSMSAVRMSNVHSPHFIFDLFSLDLLFCLLFFRQGRKEGPAQ